MWPRPLNPPVRNWKNRRVWLVGASSGIGAALALAMAREGAVLALSARRKEALDDVAADCPGALVVPLDVSEAEAWTQAWRQIAKHWEAPDLVVFCAADYQPQRAWQLEPAQAGRTVETNLTSIYYGLCTVLPGMMAQRAGGLVLVASVAGYMGLPNATVYGPTKAAMINLAELLYQDLHPHGLGVYLVNPGFVRTPLTEKNDFAMPALQTPEQAAQAIMSGLRAGRFEIAFPRVFTLLLKWTSMLPYRWRFALLEQVLGPT